MNFKVRISLIVLLLAFIGVVVWYGSMDEGVDEPLAAKWSEQDSASTNDISSVERNNRRMEEMRLKADHNITVDVSKQETSVKSMVGFLHSYRDAEPEGQYINEVSPKYWRTGWPHIPKNDKSANFSSIRGDNTVQPILVLSAMYKYPRVKKRKGSKVFTTANNEKTKWKSPAKNKEDMHIFLDMVEQQYKKFGNNVIYDVWNEPNHPAFWQGSEKEFFATFKAAHDKIRSLPGGDKAVISGPSIARFHKQYLIRFLNYCLKNNIRLDVLSWHEMRTGKKVYKIEEALKWARENWIDRHKKLGVKKIIINEMIGKEDKHSPGAALLFFKQLESGGADGACKACWKNSRGNSDCFNSSLDGLIGFDGKPRSIWWAYKYYAESTKSRLQSNSDNSELISFAYNTDKEINVLIGTGEEKAFSNTLVKLENISSIAPFSSNDKVKIECYSIPDSGEKELDKPILQSSYEATVSKNNLDVLVDKVGEKSVCLVKITKI